MLPEIPLHRPPEKLDEVELAVVLGEEEAKVTEALYGFLNKGMLLEKIGLVLEDLPAAAALGGLIAFTRVTLHQQSSLEKTTLFKNLFHSFGLSLRVNHLLLDSLTFAHKPTISHLGLLPAAEKIHTGCNQGINSIRGVALRVVDDEQSAVFVGIMERLKSRDDLLHKLSIEWSLSNAYSE